MIYITYSNKVRYLLKRYVMARLIRDKHRHIDTLIES